MQENNSVSLSSNTHISCPDKQVSTWEQIILSKIITDTDELHLSLVYMINAMLFD